MRFGGPGWGGRRRMDWSLPGQAILLAGRGEWTFWLAKGVNVFLGLVLLSEGVNVLLGLVLLAKGVYVVLGLVVGSLGGGLVIARCLAAVGLAPVDAVLAVLAGVAASVLLVALNVLALVIGTIDICRRRQSRGPQLALCGIVDQECANWWPKVAGTPKDATDTAHVPVLVARSANAGCNARGRDLDH